MTQREDARPNGTASAVRPAEGGGLGRSLATLREDVTPVPYWTAGFAVPWLVLGVLVVVGATSLSPYGFTVWSQIGIYAIAILGLNILVGFAGQISFGHNAFLGIGGYLSALATVQWGLPPIAGVLAGVLISAVLGVIIGYPTLRLRGHYLALATFAVGLGFYNLAISSPLFNGFMGIAGIPPFRLLGYNFASLRDKFVLVWVVVLIAIVVAWRFRQLRFGRALRSLADDEATAKAVGINVQRYKVIAFVISAVFTSVAGSLYAHTVSFVSPETFGFATIVLLFVMLFIGGLGTVWGSLLGAAAGIALPDVLVEFGRWTPSVFALIVLAVVMLRPVGLLAPLPKGLQRRISATTDRWLSRGEPDRA